MKSSTPSPETSQKPPRIGKKFYRNKAGKLVAIGVTFNPNGESARQGRASSPNGPTPSSASTPAKK